MKKIIITGIRGVPAEHGGFETFAENIAVYLVKNGWHVTVYCQESISERNDVYESNWQGVKRIHIPVKGEGAKSTIIFDYLSIKNASKQSGIVLTLGYNTGLFNLLFRLKGMHNIINMDGIEWKRDKWKWHERAWLYLNERVSCLIGSHLVADHPEIKNHLTTRVADNKVTMIPYGAREVVMADPSLLKVFNIEPKAIWSKVNPNEDLIGSYSTAEASYFLNEADGSLKQKRNINKIFGFYLGATFSKRVVDKYPELIFRVPYVKSLFPDAKFLFLVRNGWDTCSSIEKWSERLSTCSAEGTHDWWGVNNRKWSLLVEQIIKKDEYFKTVSYNLSDITSHVDMAALEWIATMRQGLKMLEKYPESILRVDYESLVKNPITTLADIEAFSQLTHDEKYIHYGECVLRPVEGSKSFDLHPEILPLFIETMEALNYQ